MRRLFGVASVALITAGAVVLLDVGLTLAWGEPMTTFRGWMAQRQAAEDLTKLEQSFANTERADQRRPVSRLAARQLREAEPGQPIGRLVVRPERVVQLAKASCRWPSAEGAVLATVVVAP